MLSRTGARALAAAAGCSRTATAVASQRVGVTAGRLEQKGGSVTMRAASHAPRSFPAPIPAMRQFTTATSVSQDGHQSTWAQPPLRPSRPPHAMTCTDAELDDYLSAILPTLRLSRDVAQQMVTDRSAWEAMTLGANHNRRLSFLGRRVLDSYLTLFLYTHLARSPDSVSSPRTPNIAHIVRKSLDTDVLGDSVGEALALEKVMRWTPAVREAGHVDRRSGLFKIRGRMVEAMVGAVFHQHGGHLSHLFFLSRVLPYLPLLPSSLSEVVKQAAERASAELGVDSPSQQSHGDGAAAGRERAENEQERIRQVKVAAAA